MNTKLTAKSLKFDKDGVRKAATLAHAGALGNEFWQEVSEQVQKESEGLKVAPRKLRDDR